MKTILILPAYNEGRVVADIVRASKLFVSEVLVVNDGSVDDTAHQASDAGAEVLTHRVNLGKAAALKTGCEAALTLGADIIALMDSDGQHRPTDIPRLVRPIQDGETDIVIGRRQGGGKMPLVRNLGNHFIYFAVRTLFGVAIHDVLSGFRAFRASVYPRLRWETRRYQVETEMTARIGHHRLRYKEVPIDIIYNDSYKGMSISDGFKILGNIVWWRLIL